MPFMGHLPRGVPSTPGAHPAHSHGRRAASSGEGAEACIRAAAYGTPAGTTVVTRVPGAKDFVPWVLVGVAGLVNAVATS